MCVMGLASALRSPYKSSNQAHGRMGLAQDQFTSDCRLGGSGVSGSFFILASVELCDIPSGSAFISTWRGFPFRETKRKKLHSFFFLGGGHLMSGLVFPGGFVSGLAFPVSKSETFRPSRMLVMRCPGLAWRKIGASRRHQAPWEMSGGQPAPKRKSEQAEGSPGRGFVKTDLGGEICSAAKS